MTVDFVRDLFWAIDPGESKCGVAVFDGGMARTAYKSTPDETLDLLWHDLHIDDSQRPPSARCNRPRAVVLERFALRADLAPQQKGSEMGTSQMIGAIRWMCRQTGTPVYMQTPMQAHSLEKAAPFNLWPLRKWVSYGQGRDAKMAELHGLFRISTSLNKAQRNVWHGNLLRY